MTEFVTDGHLGGFFRGGDPDTQYPALWQWLVKELGVCSMLDVGCGDGAALEVFGKFGVDCVGIDGINMNHPLIVTHDYTTGPSRLGRTDYDLVWSCEFVEHVEERFVPNFMADFCRGQVVAMTHAVPGQGGWHHVNCRDDAYWIDVFESYGYEHDVVLTKKARRKARFHANPQNYFVKSGLVFRKNA